jgi:hypothetical protein
MNTIHDVLRFIIARLRPVAAEQDIAAALAVIAAHEAAHGAPAPEPVPEQQPAPAGAEQLFAANARIAELEAQLAAAPAQAPAPEPPAEQALPQQGGF